MCWLLLNTLQSPAHSSGSLSRWQTTPIRRLPPGTEFGRLSPPLTMSAPTSSFDPMITWASVSIPLSCPWPPRSSVTCSLFRLLTSSTDSTANTQQIYEDGLPIAPFTESSRILRLVLLSCYAINVENPSERDPQGFPATPTLTLNKDAARKHSTVLRVLLLAHFALIDDLSSRPMTFDEYKSLSTALDKYQLFKISDNLLRACITAARADPVLAYAHASRYHFTDMKRIACLLTLERRAREAHMKVSPSDFQDLALKYLLFRPYLAPTSAKYASNVLPVQKTLNLGVLLCFNEKVKSSHGQFSRSTFRNPPLKYPLHRETPIRASRGL